MNPAIQRKEIDAGQRCRKEQQDHRRRHGAAILIEHDALLIHIVGNQVGGVVRPTMYSSVGDSMGIVIFRNVFIGEERSSFAAS